MSRPIIHEEWEDEIFTPSLLVEPKKHPALWIRFARRIAQRKMKRQLLVPGILAWYPRAAFSSALLEGFTVKAIGKVTPRLLQLIRLQAAFQISCAFCIDINLADYRNNSITNSELLYLRTGKIITCPSLTSHEQVALAYTQSLTQTPPEPSNHVLEEMRSSFCEAEIVAISVAIAEVNYWGRLLNGLQLPAAQPLSRLKRRAKPKQAYPPVNE